MYKVLVSTHPFSTGSELPLKLLNSSSLLEYSLNPFNRKLTEDELAEMIEPFHAIIAGTEPISAKVLSRAKNLKLISRVGVGLDSVDLHFADKKGIKISYTAEAPAPAVAELTIGLILSLFRSISIADRSMREGNWTRYSGKRIGDTTIGVVGAGRIGSKVINHLQSFSPYKILVADIDPLKLENLPDNCEVASLERILIESDVVTLHVPLSRSTNGLIKKDQLLLMKKDAFIVNTSRGGIIDEYDLYEVLRTKQIAGAAVDVFEIEPYNGPLRLLENCLLTSHMGSMSLDCRSKMEIEATEEVINYLEGKSLQREVPKYEYPE